jgi:transposase InsO family protein
VHSRKRGLSRKPGRPVHDDLVLREFTAERPNLLWLTDITEHPTAEGTGSPLRGRGRLLQADRR